MDAKKVLPYVTIAMVIGVGVSYMLFLAFTWRQMQADRTRTYSRVDEIIDRMTAKPEADDSADAGPCN